MTKIIRFLYLQRPFQGVKTRSGNEDQQDEFGSTQYILYVESCPYTGPVEYESNGDGSKADETAGPLPWIVLVSCTKDVLPAND